MSAHPPEDHRHPYARAIDAAQAWTERASIGGRSVCTCGHVGSRHGHYRQSCAAVDCRCASFRLAEADR